MRASSTEDQLRKFDKFYSEVYKRLAEAERQETSRQAAENAIDLSKEQGVYWDNVEKDE